MNLKKRLLTTLLLTVLIPALSAETSKKSNRISATELGIDLNKSYQGTEVQNIIEIVLEEADKSIDNAYKEGYKQATLELQPEVEYWKTMYQVKKGNTISNNIKFTLIGFGAGFLLGGAGGIAVGMRIPIN